MPTIIDLTPGGESNSSIGQSASARHEGSSDVPPPADSGAGTGGAAPEIGRAYEKKRRIGKKFIGAAVVGVLIIFFAMFVKLPQAKKAPAANGNQTASSPQAGQQATAGTTATAPQQPPTAQDGLPTSVGQSSASQPPIVSNQNTTPDDVLHTRKSNNSLGGQPIGSIEDFKAPQPDQNGQWSPAPYGSGTGAGGNYGGGYSGGGGTGREYQARKTDAGSGNSNQPSPRMLQLQKPSMTFVLVNNTNEPAHLAASPETAEEKITNFGYIPGFHIGAHLEAVATTATHAPVIAVVDYNYRRNGETIIPAGSKVIGTIGESTSTGIMGINFTTIHLPNGEDIPVSAIGLDHRMGPIKGTVTGKNRAKQFLIATLAGVGSATAMFAGNNASGSLSESDVLRNQMAQNMGQAADGQIQSLAVSEHLIVTVPAGTQVEVTFVTPVKAKASATSQKQ